MIGAKRLRCQSTVGPTQARNAISTRFRAAIADCGVRAGYTYERPRDNRIVRTMRAAIPVSLQERLLAVADHLPEEKRAQFIRAVCREAIEAVNDHPRTLIYCALGWLLGEILDQLTFNIPIKELMNVLTADRASDIGAAVGLFNGFLADCRTNAEADQMGRVVAKCLREAIG